VGGCLLVSENDVNHIIMTEAGGILVMSVLAFLALLRICHYLKVAVLYLKEVAIELRMARRKGTHSRSVETPAVQDQSDVDGGVRAKELGRLGEDRN
jgi:hypothetical protein